MEMAGEMSRSDDLDEPSAPSGHIPRNILQAGRNWIAPINCKYGDREKCRKREWREKQDDN